MQIQEFFPDKVDETILDKYIDFEIEYQKEIYPNDPTAPPELLRRAMLTPSSEYNIFRWLVFSDLDEIMGYARLNYHKQNSPMYESNKGIADINIVIKKEFRKQGIGSKLLKVLVKKAKELEMKSFQIVANLEAGKKFIEHFGGIVAADRTRNRLYYNEIDWEKIQKWCEEGKERTKDVTIETFEDVPEEDLEEFVKVYTVTENQAPDYETGDYQGLKISPESRRSSEKRYKEIGYTWITKISREKDGTISGFTEIFYNIHLPHMVEQEMTGVLPEYRGRGLGKRLKAEMLFYIKENYPNIDFIETGNANKNKPMLVINTEIGYKKHIEEYLMKLDIKEIEKRGKKYI